MLEGEAFGGELAEGWGSRMRRQFGVEGRSACPLGAVSGSPPGTRWPDRRPAFWWFSSGSPAQAFARIGQIVADMAIPMIGVSPAPALGCLFRSTSTVSITETTRGSRGAVRQVVRGACRFELSVFEKRAADPHAYALHPVLRCAGFTTAPQSRLPPLAAEPPPGHPDVLRCKV